MVLAGFPVSAARAGEPLRVLLLGVGGGAVVRQLHQLFTIDTVVGIEIDPTHIEIANRWFGIAKLPSVTLVQADAVDWVKNYKGPGFDLVIDDLFGHATTDVCRAVPFTRRWAKQLVALLEPDGAVVANTAGGVEFHQAATELDAALAAVRGKQPVEISGIRLTHPDYDNQMLAGLTTPLGHYWRQAWQASSDTSMHYSELSSSKKNRVRRCLAAHLRLARRVF